MAPRTPKPLLATVAGALVLLLVAALGYACTRTPVGPPGPGPRPSTTPFRAPTPGQWQEVSCATGAITTHGPGSDPAVGHPLLQVRGWFRPCAEDPPPNSYVFIRYSAREGRRGPLIPYRASQTEFTWNIDYTHARQELGDLSAVCLSSGADGRIACLGVEFDRPDGTPTVTPIPTDDPRVGVPVSDLPLVPDYGATTTCATCA